MLQIAATAHGSDDTCKPLNVLVCPDQPMWAFDNIANNIAEMSGDNRVFKLFMCDVIGNERKFFETLFLKRIDVCHVLWREDLFFLLHPSTLSKVAQEMGLGYGALVRALNSCAFTSSVYDHLFTSEPELAERRTGFAMLDGYTVSSQRLFDIYRAYPEIPAPDCVITDGVDCTLFKPRPYPRSTDCSFTIGWAGNSAWGKHSQGYDVKGYGRLFLPLIDQLIERGYKVETKIADPQVARIPFDKMPDFYRSLDLFVCTSAIEGTPNTVLEAMACGVPVISSDVGIVPDIFGKQQKRFILRESSVGAFADAATKLICNPQLRHELGLENRTQALGNSWDQVTARWWPFWQSVMLRASDRRNAIRREKCLMAQG